MMADTDQQKRTYFYDEAATKVVLIIQWIGSITADPNILIRENLRDGLLELVEYCFCGVYNTSFRAPKSMDTSESFQKVCRKLLSEGGALGAMTYYPDLLMKLREWMNQPTEMIKLTAKELQELRSFCETIAEVENAIATE